jgi:hypothetical protein
MPHYNDNYFPSSVQSFYAAIIPYILIYNILINSLCAALRHPMSKEDRHVASLLAMT